MNQILAVENNKKEDNNLKKNENINTSEKPNVARMNQINNSTVKTKIKTKTTKSGKPIEIEGIIKFFAIALLFFGVVFIGQGSYAIYKEADDKKIENIPSVIIGRVNDKAIVRIENSIEISKLVYSWNNGEETAIPIGGTNAEVEIVLVGYDSTLNLTVEDINGKRIKYQKIYQLTGVDITKPSINIEVKDGSNKMTIIATDETEISYLTYQWENEEPITITASEEGQKEIAKVIELTKGTKEIKITAEDKNGNVEKIIEPVTVTEKPEIHLKKNGSTISIEAIDKDGIKDIKINLNGKELSATNLNRKNVKTKQLQLREGNNTISVEITNVNGYSVRATKEITYNP